MKNDDTKVSMETNFDPATLEGEAAYIGKGQIVCSKRVPGSFEPKFCHPYYWTVKNLYYDNLKEAKLLKHKKEAKLPEHKYFHH